METVEPGGSGRGRERQHGLGGGVRTDCAKEGSGR